MSSAYYPQGNGRAELAVKAAKRILATNISASGKLNRDSAARSFLLQRNTPVQDVDQSPAMMLYGRNLKDQLPSVPLRMRKEWSDIANRREQGMAKRHIRNAERYNEHTKCLSPLEVGDVVALQNQSGKSPLRWYRTGYIVEVIPQTRQYRVKVDGSHRVTLRNRRFLRKIDPICRVQGPVDGDFRDAKGKVQNHSTAITPLHDSTQNQESQEVIRSHNSEPEIKLPSVLEKPTTQTIRGLVDKGGYVSTEASKEPGYESMVMQPSERRSSSQAPEGIVIGEGVHTGQLNEQTENQSVQKSMRMRKPRVLFSPQMKGKSHGKGT